MNNASCNTETAPAPMLTESVRIPLHSLQADLGYLIGRVIADGSCGPMIIASIRERLDQIEASLLWQPIETAPHGKRVLLGWYDWRDHQWCVEVGPATTGQRFDNGYSNLSQHGSATHWMSIPAGPAVTSRK